MTKTSDANTVLVAEAVQAKLDEIAARHPGTIVVTTVSDLSDFIKESTDGLIREGGLGALFAVLTIFLFLFSLRSTLVAAISIPLSILTALVIMQLTGISLNIMTLGGLAVAVGRVVDDAIVVLENIYRHRALGEDRWTAVAQRPARGRRRDHRQHADDGRGLPAARLRRRPGQPVLPALRPDRHVRAAGVARLRPDGRAGPRLLPHRQGERQGRRERRAGRLALGPLVHAGDHVGPALALDGPGRRGVSGVLFFASLSLVSQLPTQFINAGSEKILQVSVAPPSGASSEAVLEHGHQAETILDADPDVELIQTSIPGEGDTSFQTIIAAQSGRPATARR